MLIMHKRFVSLIKISNVANNVKAIGKQKHHKSTWTFCTVQTTPFSSPPAFAHGVKNGIKFCNIHLQSSYRASSNHEEKAELSSPEKLTNDLVHHLERTSLVDFDNAEAVARLSEAIRFADQLFEVNTEGVKPLVTVLENESLYLREDVPEPTNRKEILQNASITDEDYFVAPPGNIPLEPTSKVFLEKEGVS